jgi:hypothetical protein
MGVGDQRQSPAALPPGKRLGTHCTGGWVGPRAGLDRCACTRGTTNYMTIKHENRTVELQQILKFYVLGTNILLPNISPLWPADVYIIEEHQTHRKENDN